MTDRAACYSDNTAIRIPDAVLHLYSEHRTSHMDVSKSYVEEKHQTPMPTVSFDDCSMNHKQTMAVSLVIAPGSGCLTLES